MTLSWLTAVGQAHSITMALYSIMDEIRTSHGCIGCSLSVRLTHRAVIRYVEDWQTEEDLRRRLRSTAFSRVAALTESAVKTPRVEFALPGGVRGLEFVEEVQQEVQRARS